MIFRTVTVQIDRRRKNGQLQVFTFTPGTSLQVERGTGIAKERRLLLYLFYRVWRKRVNQKEWLQNKLLVVQEIDGMTEIMETIKLMQSEGKIARLTTYENPKTGKREIQVLHKNVALSVLTTTTRDRIPSEKATRIFEIQDRGEIAGQPADPHPKSD
jgi:hypothetical protein